MLVDRGFALGCVGTCRHGHLLRQTFRNRLAKETAVLLVRLQQCFDTLAQGRVAGARFVKEGRALFECTFFKGFHEDVALIHVYYLAI